MEVGQEGGFPINFASTMVNDTTTFTGGALRGLALMTRAGFSSATAHLASEPYGSRQLTHPNGLETIPRRPARHRHQYETCGIRRRELEGGKAPCREHSEMSLVSIYACMCGELIVATLLLTAFCHASLSMSGSVHDGKARYGPVLPL
jgi:hypothetical protein